MVIPGIGIFKKDERFGELLSEPFILSILNNVESQVILEEYEQDENKEDFHIVISNFISAPFTVLEEAQNNIYKYYLDMKELWHREGVELVPIQSPNEIWAHIEFGSPVVTRRASGVAEVYVSIECSCSWEQEHGLQIVLKSGNKVCKVWPYNGHLTNADAYNNLKLENIVYVSLA